MGAVKRRLESMLAGMGVVASSPCPSHAHAAGCLRDYFEEHHTLLGDAVLVKQDVEFLRAPVRDVLEMMTVLDDLEASGVRVTREERSAYSRQVARFFVGGALEGVFYVPTKEDVGADEHGV